jgi:hypothetical protein
MKEFTCKYLWKRLTEREDRMATASSEEAKNFFWKKPDFRLYKVNSKAEGVYHTTAPGCLVVIKSYDWTNCRLAETEEASFDRNDVLVLVVHDGEDWIDADSSGIEEHWISSIVLDRVNEEEYGVSFDTPEQQEGIEASA